MACVVAFINPRLSTSNVGDVFIEDGVKRILRYDAEASFDIDPRQPIRSTDIDRINEADVAVIVGTNLWYRHMAKPGRWQFRISDLKRIRVPVIPIGVGTTRHFGEDNGFDYDTLEQLRIIHSSCTLGSARDIRTAEALSQAGIANVAVTGCPTMFRALAPAWRLRRNPGARKIVLTVRKGQKRNVQRLLKLLYRRGLEPVVAAQQPGDRFLSYGIPFMRPAVPTLFRWSIESYLRLVEECCGVIGWRLHGNMLHLAHGRPAMLFSNCSRGDSFCDLFGLPTLRSPDHAELSESSLERMIERLFDDATFAHLPGRYEEVRSAMADFLTANGLGHRLEAEQFVHAA
jgi:hypothetical protein